jgi:hypothetical protein
LSVNIVPNTRTYALTTTEPGDIVRLGGAVNTIGDIQPAFMPAIGTLTLRDNPTTAQTWTVTVIKQPPVDVAKDGTSSLPDGYLITYGQPILWGLLGAMMGHINKPYSNGQMGLFYMRKFRGAMTIARSAQLHQKAFGVNTWAYPQGFASRGQRGGVSVGITSANRFFG